MSTPPAPLPARAVIFDLDGTLVQTRVASWEIFKRVNDRFDLGVNSPEQYFALFQGNVFRSLEQVCQNIGKATQADEVKQAFLDLLREDYTPRIVPGIAEVVRTLATHCTLAVMSSNATQVLRRVLVDSNIALCFAHVFGGDVTPDKRTAIRAFLTDAGNGSGRRCSADYDEIGHVHAPDPSSTVLVTDTAGDVRDARQSGIRVVGVAWGMHAPEELTAAGAEFVALWPQELSAYLLGDTAAAGPAGACAVPPSIDGTGGGGDCCESCASPSSGIAQRAREAGAIRRNRRRAAAIRRDNAQSVPPTELLTAVRIVVHGG